MLGQGPREVGLRRRWRSILAIALAAAGGDDPADGRPVAGRAAPGAAHGGRGELRDLPRRRPDPDGWS